MSLGRLFYPRSVAVIGGSSDPSRIGGQPIHFMKESGFLGSIYPINPKHSEIQGLPAYPSLDSVDEQVDLAIIAVPRTEVVKAIESCARNGVKGAVVFTAGFSETGLAEDREAEQQAVEIARKAGMRLIGPNCGGFFNVRENMYAIFTQTFQHGMPKPGNIAIVMQSGAMATHCFVMLRERGYGLSILSTLGNECDVEFSDSLSFIAADKNTNVIIAGMEGCRDGAKLLAAFRVAREHQVPVIMLKVGESEVGSMAARSHTGALSGENRTFDMVFRKFGIYRAKTIDEALDIAIACSVGSFPVLTKESPGRIGLVTLSGGIGILMADTATSVGLDVPALPQRAQKLLREILPYSAVRNPIDVTAQVINDPSLLEKNLMVILEEDCFDAIVLFLGSFGLNNQLMKNIMAGLMKVRRAFPDRLIILSTIVRSETQRELEANGFFIYPDPTRAVEVASALMTFGRQRHCQSEHEIHEPPQACAPYKPFDMGNEISELESKKLLTVAGLPVIDETLVKSMEEAWEAAESHGLPVAMKIVSAQIQHKSEMGGVILGVSSRAGVEDGYETLINRANNTSPDAVIDGILVTPMITGGVETVLGVQRDPIFGPLIMFGIGGIFVEIYEDVVFRIAPFDVNEAHKMIREIKGFALLNGARGRPLVDVDALADALVKLSSFAAVNIDTVESIDINPMIVRTRGEGAVIVDAAIFPRKLVHDVRE